MAHDPRPVLDELDFDGPLVMGILNTTPDSFSDGGRWATVDRGVAYAEQMLRDGADIIDIGGESSRPGADPVSLDEELNRTIPVIEALAGRCVISIDTAKPEVAEAAIAAGAHLVNDITASLEAVAASGNAGWIAMHMQGRPQTMQDDPHYDDVVAEVGAGLVAAGARGRAAGVDHVWLDPGIGFGKTTDHNLTLLRHLPQLIDMVGDRLLVGVSRKRFIGDILAINEQNIAEVGANDRREGSMVCSVWSWLRGAHIVRVHDVRVTALAARHIRQLAHLNRDGH